MPREGSRTSSSPSSRPSSPANSSRFSPLRGSSPSTPRFSSPSPTRRHTFSASIMEENVQIADAVITKWNVDGSSSSDYLFVGDRREARQFLRSVTGLQDAMRFLVTEDSGSETLVRAQKLMEIAMKRLQKEFYRILSANRDRLDPENASSRSSARSSVSDLEDDASEDEIQVAGDGPVSQAERISELAMSDLKAIADSMISTGYGKECLKIYKMIRKSIVEESLYHLGVDRLSSSQFKKMDWEVIEPKINSWLHAVKIAVKTLFHGERILCDRFFSGSARISASEQCFAEIAVEGATTLFGFPELVAKYKKLSPEKIFCILDLYDGIAELWPEIDFIFSTELTSAVKSQAIKSLVKLGEAVRAMLSDFDAAIQKDASKLGIPGGGVHPLTSYVMNYVVFLSDYTGILSDIISDWPLPMQSPMPDSYFSSPESDDIPTSAISVLFAWLILVLLCKLDMKAELYKDVSLSYLFLANNLNYVVSKVRTSNLKLLLGDDWLANHEEKVKQYAANYERMGWSKVISSLPGLNPTASISPEAARESFRSFNSGFEEAYRKQTSWVIPDPKLRDEIKTTLARKLVPTYRAFYEKYRTVFRREIGVESVVRYAPEDLDNYLLELFSGMKPSGSISSSSSSSHSQGSSTSHSRGRRVR